MKIDHILIGMIIGLLSISQVAFSQVKEGEEAPDFVHQSLEGERYQLSELEGKVVYIFFFGASCPHCESNGPATEKAIYQNFKSDTNFVALGLDTWNESASSVEAFKNTTGISYPLLLNAEQTLVDYYGNSYSYDRSVVVSPKGFVAYKGTDYVDTDTTEVKNTIKDLLSGLNTNIEDPPEKPVEMFLHQNYPNPFNPTTNVKYELGRAVHVNLTVYTVLGQPVKTLVDRQQSAGSYSVKFDGTGLPSGVYIYRLETEGFTAAKKMQLLK